MVCRSDALPLTGRADVGIGENEVTVVKAQGTR